MGMLAKRQIMHYLDNRQLEWPMSSALITTGIAMLAFPRMATNGSILQVLVHSIGGTGAAILFVVVGLLGIAALVANGSSARLGPHIRSITAIVRAVLWASFTMSMVRVSVDQGFPSPMVFFWSFFTLAELYTPYRAVLDVRNGH